MTSSLPHPREAFVWVAELDPQHAVEIIDQDAVYRNDRLRRGQIAKVDDDNPAVKAARLIADYEVDGVPQLRGALSGVAAVHIDGTLQPAAEAHDVAISRVAGAPHAFDDTGGAHGPAFPTAAVFASFAVHDDVARIPQY